ncbi:hypothetical protein [Actibacterium ureilyticum]|uniref:hypothetical protein n=1 Tax=Actibacterium ureilyticum TaxID=1590614 RepID=UPI001595F576|nr:hypothetical protein [Actibacterium ureilyticum]
MKLLRMIGKTTGQRAKGNTFDKRLETLETDADTRRVQVSAFGKVRNQPVRRAA